MSFKNFLNNTTKKIREEEEKLNEKNNFYKNILSEDQYNRISLSIANSQDDLYSSMAIDLKNDLDKIPDWLPPKATINEEMVDNFLNDPELNKLLNQWLEYESKSKEKHLPGYNYCGPGTKVIERLMRGDAPINELDGACQVHDVEYMIYAKDYDAIDGSDKKLMKSISGMSWKNFFSKMLVKAAFFLKTNIAGHKFWEQILFTDSGMSELAIRAIGKWAASKYLKLKY